MNKLNAKLRHDERGITTALAALWLLGILFSVSYFVNVGGMLLTRARLQTMAEFSAAAGGRMVAELMGDMYYEHLAERLGHPPTEVELREQGPPQKWLTADDIVALQDALMQDRVRAAVSAYLNANKFPPFPTVSESGLRVFGPGDTSAGTELGESVAIYFPVAKIDCGGSQGTGQTTTDGLQIKVVIQYQYPFLLSGVVKNFTTSDPAQISATGVYLIKICR